MTEAELQAQVVQLAGLCGWRVMHVRKSVGRRGGKSAWQTTTSIKGWPDCAFWRPGCFFVAELKSDTGTVSADQKAVLAELREAGVPSFVWRPRDWDEIQAALQHGPTGLGSGHAVSGPGSGADL